MISTVLASSEGLDFGQIFTSLALILVLAKLAAELCERFHIPAVLGEITAGIIVGPSALGLVSPSDSLRVLAEIGVIILLVEVGLEMDLNELRRVGKASMLVAILGVLFPMSTGILAGSALGESLNASLFLGAALAATSVGITARVFGDLKALSSTEARIVLGAAVADDVLGLIILTVVTRVVEQGSIDAMGLLTTIGLAVGFLIVAGAVGLLLVPRVFKFINAKATSPATIGVVAAGITFAFSAAASGAKLAPIIGAFVAGTALARTEHHDRIARDFSVLGAIFIPVFFMQIGIDTDVTKFFSTHVLVVAGILTVIAIAGKVIASVGAFGTNTDKLLIGIGMIPRGEVGLIFATIGVQIGVFNDDLYAVVLLMVLLTTLITPPLLRWRIESGESALTSEIEIEVTEEPTGGWIRLINNEVQLHGNPAPALTLQLALEASLLASHAQPNTQLLDWMHRNRLAPLTWTKETTQLLVDVLSRGNSRSWRFLEITNVIDRALPEIANALRSRHGAASELDPTHQVQLPIVEALRKNSGRVEADDSSLLLAGLMSDFSDGADISQLVNRLVLSEAVQKEAQSLVLASMLLLTECTADPYEPNQRVLAQLAQFLGTPRMVEKCRMLTEARGGLQDVEFSILIDITTNVQALLAHPELIEGIEDSLESVRRRDAIALCDNQFVIERIQHAAAVYILAHDPETIARHATLVEPAPRARTVRVGVNATNKEDEWEIDIATRDMRGLLARICATLSERGFEIINADLATWPDGAVLDSFTVRSQQKPNAAQLSFELEQRLRKRIENPRRLTRGTKKNFEFALDNGAHPWHSIVLVRGVNQPGFIQAVAAAFARANINVHHAKITTEGDEIADRFEVSTRHGRKISQQALQRVNTLLS